MDLFTNLIKTVTPSGGGEGMTTCAHSLLRGQEDRKMLILFSGMGVSMSTARIKSGDCRQNWSTSRSEWKVRR